MTCRLTWRGRCLLLSSVMNLSGVLANGSSIGRLSGTIPDGITLLTSLSALDLSGNLLQGTIPNGITALKNLVSVALLLGSYVPDLGCMATDLWR